MIKSASKKTLKKALVSSLLAHSDKIAMRHGANAITYRQLWDRAEALRQSIEVRCDGHDHLIAICCASPVQHTIAMIAVILEEQVYLPIDVSVGEQRKQAILKHSGARMMITDEQSFVELNEAPCGQQLEEVLNVIFTSGSTGQPKGVKVGAGPSHHMYNWYSNKLDLSHRDRAFICSSFSFDLTQKNLIAPLLCGASLVFPAQKRFDPESWARDIISSQATVINGAPSALFPILRELTLSDTELRHLVFAGEPLDKEKVQALVGHDPTVQVHNYYGPTECTDLVTWQTIDCASEDPIAIGRPIEGTHIYVLHQGNETRQGEIGEICVSGFALAYGYLNDAEQDAEKFVNFNGQIVYRTGDLGYLDATGTLYYKGRIDDEYKIAGVRVHRMEIESACKQCFATDNLALVKCDDRLVLFYLDTDATAFKDASLKSAKASFVEHLPLSMFPKRTMALRTFPLNPNGKLDYKALKSLANEQRESRSGDNVAPASNAMSSVVAACHTLEITMTEDWLDLPLVGGLLDSLLVVEFIYLLRQSYPCVSYDYIYAHNSVSALSVALTECQDSVSDEPQGGAEFNDTSLLPVSLRQQDAIKFTLESNNSFPWIVTSAIQFDTSVSTQAIAAAQAAFVQRHRVLNGRFSLSLGRIVYDVDSARHPLPLTFTATDSEQGLNQMIAQMQTENFNRFTGPLYRHSLIETPQGRVLVFVVDHIIFDGESQERWFKELAELDDGSVDETEHDFFDFIKWQNERLLDMGEYAQIREFWQMYLAKPYIANSELAGVSDLRSHQPGVLEQTLTETLIASVDAYARHENVDRFTVLFYCFALVLKANTALREHIDIETLIHGRTKPSCARAIGLFANVLTFRYTPELSLNDFHRDLNNLYVHQEIPKFELDKIISPDKPLNGEFMFSYQKYNTSADQALHAINARRMVDEPPVARHKLNVLLRDRGESCVCAEWIWHLGAAKTPVISRLSEAFEQTIINLVGE
ncbi:AMP-binding protein [Vibrio lentus]|uniref:Carrier domain-containing protein n=1 Tax=Vibrio lentus TaxID=136468 RepID=A0A2N7BJ35_9VIBR|nr:AMP-binding protein [Vibrio lentus]PME48232.1 hypothetical protein BCV34_15940 [Vibrio lentus]PME56559.1 hypothetical protein BCV30_19120 [Vibrio lentus]PME92352.1 hypothetical protein BCV27_21965 [Vibrio lentus]PMI12047.1 hypothetical protein BCU53_21875 [Vibrio lentus]PMK88831.1 hypothetical protein BCT90_06105 [Vibrio lentus]